MAENSEAFEALLDYLKRSRGIDFSVYKRSSLVRRIEKRLQTVKVSRYVEYIDYLEVHPDEFELLFNTILINVTSFFRDPEFWERLQTTHLPALIASRDEGAPLRVWSAGCASGEEAYSLAIVLTELLGADAFRERVKIYATDADEEALAQARQGKYDATAVEGLSAELRERYFDVHGDAYTFKKDLRRCVIFGRHDLVQDSPISRLDLIVCRNTLMYFNAEVQVRILARFHFALGDGGVLFLGKAETILQPANGFSIADAKGRIFAKLERSPRDSPRARSEGEAAPKTDLAQLRESAIESIPLAQILSDPAGRLVHANAHARGMFNLTHKDFGRPLRDLEISYRPAELRSPIEQSYQERRPIMVRDVAWAIGPEQARVLDVRIAPLYDAGTVALGVSVTFEDVTRIRQLQLELQRSNRELEAAAEEVQSANEELETTNEELQSTVEELETTNEELQSTNEELQTMNEELQSTNGELTMINDELRNRGDDLRLVNLQLETVMSSMRGGIIVVDRELRVQNWNRQATELWGLRTDEVVGKDLLTLDIGLPVERLQKPIRDSMAGGTNGTPVVLTATNRRGRSIELEVLCTPLTDREDGVLGAILLMDERNPISH